MRNPTPTDGPKVDIRASALTIANGFRLKPTGGDRRGLAAGRSFLAFQISDEFSAGLHKHREAVRELILTAIEELSEGGRDFKSHGLYLVFRFGKPQTCKALYDSSPEGRVAVSIQVREFASFKAWREAGDDDLDQETINCAVFSLCFELSRFL